MFRRKEESLFDNELLEETESFTVQPASSAPAAPAASAAPVAASAPQVAAPAASVQPITRPAAPPAPVAATGFRPSAPQPVAQSSAASNASNTNNNTNISRPAEGKPMTPITSPNSAQNAVKPNHRVLTVGNDILLKGEIATCDRFVIEGRVEATINDVHTLELAECGSFKGSANVVDAHISGLFEGDLVVTGRLIIHASGKVRGNVSYGEVEIERGGELTGQIKTAGTVVANSSVPKAIRKEAA